MNNETKIFLESLSNLLKNASETHMAGYGTCYIITDGLRNETICNIESILSQEQSVRKGVIQVNIKEKLIEQIQVLEKAQQVAFAQAEPNVVVSISMAILELVKYINEDIFDDDYVCPNCEEAMMQKRLHKDIATASDMPIDIVKRVLAGQDAVLDK